MTTNEQDQVRYVVRTKRSGKFVRAFLTESQAASWCDSHAQWFYRAESPTAPDADGRVYRHLWPR